MKGYIAITSTYHLISLFQNDADVLQVTIKENDLQYEVNIIFRNETFVFPVRSDVLKYKIERWKSDDFHKSYIGEAIRNGTIYYKLNVNENSK